MKAITEYIIAITSAAVMCGCICSYFEKKGAISAVLKILCGIFLAITALKPVINIQLPELSSIITSTASEAEQIVSDAQSNMNIEQQTYISNQTESYIYQKAISLGCEITVSVLTTSEPPYTPNSIHLSGNISPYAKKQLSQWIYDNFSIHPEDITWDG